jgi:hypothetical protein
MPVVHYYLGRPADVLIAAMSPRGPARARAAGASTAAAPASPRPGSAASQPGMPPAGDAPRITAAVTSAWAAQWFSARGC